MNEKLIDEIVPVNGKDAMRLSRELATREGIFVGTSSGATLAAALEVAQRAPSGSHIVCMLPDTGERYLSTPLFEGISVDMTEDELAVSRSTPSCRFDPPASAAPAVQAAAPAPVKAPALQPVTDQHAEDFVSQVIADNGVVMFALEWCEFCWAVRRMLARMSVTFKSVDIDSVEYQADDMGTRIRSVLKQRTGQPTIPQIWIGGVHVGGAMDLFDAMRSGRMQRLLIEAKVRYDHEAQIDPAEFLPKWLHPRKAA